VGFGTDWLFILADFFIHILLFLLKQIDKEKMKEALSPDMLATDLAYYLVRKGVSIGILSHLRNSRAPIFGPHMYMLSECEMIDTENISLLSQNMKFVGE